MKDAETPADTPSRELPRSGTVDVEAKEKAPHSGDSR
jgi:sec-independent protein translocase protein TatA